MGRKAKVSLEEKLEAVNDYLSGLKGGTQICYEMSVTKKSFDQWVRKFKLHGAEGLKTTTKNTFYPIELKYQAVTDYLNGIGSLFEICSKYDISSHSILQQWIKAYNSHKAFRSHSKQGDRIMTNGRKTTYKERTEIVAFCISNNDDYQATADKFKVSYQQVYTWVKKYKANGYEELIDRRGKRKEAAELTESDKLSAQLKLIEAENTRLKMEIDFLKKLKEVERRR
ncbi:helix-turn-helix domain-containing protein [Clostridium beijerinckii]|uniref:helix-turn-helix domain-containing protein n=1 Tax=Clostridium beijerinckii TaxID=1520 RepID=UPI003B58A1F8